MGSKFSIKKQGSPRILVNFLSVSNFFTMSSQSLSFFCKAKKVSGSQKINLSHCFTKSLLYRLPLLGYFGYLVADLCGWPLFLRVGLHYQRCFNKCRVDWLLGQKESGCGRVWWPFFVRGPVGILRFHYKKPTF